MYEVLKKYFKQYGEITDGNLDSIMKYAKKLTVRKGDFILKEGDTCKSFYLVTSGCLRLFYIKDGVDISVWFSFENNSAIELYSYLSGSPSEYFIECIEDGEVIEISKNNIDSLCKSYPSIDTLFNFFWRDVVQNLLKRMTSIQKYSSKERYLNLLNDTDYLNRIPQKYLASYIGVTSTSLSRIRRNIKSKLS